MTVPLTDSSGHGQGERVRADAFLPTIRRVPVSSIMTLRDDLLCEQMRNVQAVEGNPELADFDQIPLVNAEGHIEAVWVRGEGERPLSESTLMSADAPLLDFLCTADTHLFRLLVSGDRIVGLVTPSDMQRLPVYPVLFGLVVGVEDGADGLDSAAERRR